MTIEAKMPKDTIGIIGEMVVDKNERAVVSEVTSMQDVALRIVYASRSGTRLLISLMCLVCFH